MASGDHQDIARKPSGKKKRKLSQKEQSERFKKTARELDVNESGEAFERTIERVIFPWRNSQQNRG